MVFEIREVPLLLGYVFPKAHPVMSINESTEEGEPHLPQERMNTTIPYIHMKNYAGTPQTPPKDIYLPILRWMQNPQISTSHR